MNNSVKHKIFGSLASLPVLAAALLIFTGMLHAQPFGGRYNQLGQVFVAGFSSAPFPHPQRAEGRVYRDQKFPAEIHYRDSSVCIFVPKGYRPGDRTNYVVYLHGWWSNLDSSLRKFSLIEQFCESGVNAILVFPEGPKNAPDSYAGKLEDEGGLRNLIDETTGYLRSNGMPDLPAAGRIVLAGHSGAYHGIAYMLLRGGMSQAVSDVILFDALYGDMEKFCHYIYSGSGRLVNIYTDSGGTKAPSEMMMDDLRAWKIPFQQLKETALTDDILLGSRLVFIHSPLTHNEVVFRNRQFAWFLKTSSIAAKH